ncbi:hypothetical protein [Pseudomonas syringae]|uniref:hypothetical protein n=1 Tax=Pseudomonas syringae TaxID=317 RepID=UPI000C08CB25|nr:hypothetical protein [Pseudomonas syringae]PHN78366.1 hypothetical protein AO071_22900 [Pseudomonas syringae]
MVDFIKSFQKGIEAAISAENNKNEIDAVFDSLNHQLGQVSGGKLKVAIVFKSNPFVDFLAAASNSPAKGSYWAIVASNPLAESFSPKELANWKSDQNGYPCVISTDSEEIYCEDKLALEKALGHILALPDVGKKLHALMNQKLSTPSASSGGPVIGG